MGNMIGSGVFLLPASLAAFGWDAVAGWVFTIAGVLLLALVIARLTRALPTADGPHGFVLAAFGELAAFLIAWSYWIANWVGNAALAIAAVSYLSIFAPRLAAVPALPAASSIALVWAVALVNLRGPGLTGGFQLWTTLLKLLPLLLVIVLGCGVVVTTHGTALAPFPAHGFSLGGITGAAALTLWAMTGFESASLATAQIERPEIVVPRATLTGVALTGVIYLFACSAIILLLPVALTSASHAPFADFVARFWTHGASVAVALCAAIGAIGALSGLTLVQGAIPLSLARAGSFPRWFGVTNPAGTPVRAIVVSSLLTTLLLIANASRGMTELFTYMALLSTSATLFLYLGVALAALKLRVGSVVGAAAAAFALWTLWGAGLEATGWSSLLLLGGVPLFWLLRRSGRRAIAAAHAAP